MPQDPVDQMNNILVQNENPLDDCSFDTATGTTRNGLNTGT
jgi:hypothetical protein